MRDNTFTACSEEGDLLLTFLPDTEVLSPLTA